MAFAPDYAKSGRFYVDFTDRNGDTRVQEFRRSRGNPEPRRPVVAPAGAVRARSPTPTTTAGCCCSARTATSTSASGDGGSAGDPQDNAPEPRTRCSARSCGSTRAAGRRRTAPRPRTRSSAAPGATRSTPTGCATRGASRSTARPATSTSATSGRTAARRSTTRARGARRGRDFGWSCFEGRAPLRRSRNCPDPIAAGARVRARAAASARSRAASSCATGACRRSRAATSTATTARGQLRSFRIAGGKATGDRGARPDGPSLSSFGEDARGRVYATSLNGPVYRLSRASAVLGAAALPSARSSGARAPARGAGNAPPSTRRSASVRAPA